MNNKVTTGLYSGLLIATLLIVLAFDSAASSVDAARDVPDVKTQRFDILRNGSPVGTHEVRISSENELTRVKVNSRIELTFLGITVYKLDYMSEEVWDELGIRQLSVEVDNDGNVIQFAGKRSGDTFEWDDGKTVNRHLLPIYPTNHWQYNVTRQSRVLNTLTGDVDDVSIRALGREILRLPDANIAATRYRYEGELDLDTWYDDNGQWVAMRFEGKDGSTIEYVCSDCQSESMM